MGESCVAMASEQIRATTAKDEGGPKALDKRCMMRMLLENQR